MLEQCLAQGKCKRSVWWKNQCLPLDNRKHNSVFKQANDLSRYFFKEDIQMANKHTRRSSTSLAIRKCNSKTTVRYHFTPTRMAVIKSQTITSVGKDMEKLEPSSTAGGSIKWHNYFGKHPSSSSKDWTQLPCNPAISLPGVYPREMETCQHKNLYIDVCSSIIWKSQKQPTFPTEEWINMVLLYCAMSFSNKRKWNLDLYYTMG